MLELIELKNNSKYIEKSKILYNEAFPPEERWDFELTIKNKENFNYKFYSINENNNFIGIVMIWTFSEFYYIEYIAIDKNIRGNNYGSKAINQILELLSNKFIVLEVEPYELNEIAKRRIKWYEKFGFLLSNYDYNMPCIDKDDKVSTIKMQIMSTKEIKSQEYFNNIVKILIENVYTPRINNLEKWTK